MNKKDYKVEWFLLREICKEHRIYIYGPELVKFLKKNNYRIITVEVDGENINFYSKESIEQFLIYKRNKEQESRNKTKPKIEVEPEPKEEPTPSPKLTKLEKLYHDKHYEDYERYEDGDQLDHLDE